MTCPAQAILHGAACFLTFSVMGTYDGLLNSLGLRRQPRCLKAECQPLCSTKYQQSHPYRPGAARLICKYQYHTRRTEHQVRICSLMTCAGDAPMCPCICDASPLLAGQEPSFTSTCL